jgi:predicted ATPase
LEIALLLPVSDFEFIEDPQIESTPVILHMKFLHDRIRQAAYSLVTEEEKPKVHLQIGQVLLSQLSAEDQNDYLFEIVDHFNVGRHLLGSVEENIQLARLNLAAGRRAKEAIAFGSAKQYLKTGIEQLPETMWQDYHDLMFDLHKEIAETEYVLGDLGRAEALATLLLDHATTPLQKADIYRMIIMQQTTLRKYSEAIQTGRKGLALIGVKLPMKEYDLVFTNLYQEVNQLIGGGDLASLLNEPEMEDPKGTIALQILSYLLPAAYLSQNPLFAILCLIGVELSLRLGNRDESPESYSVFANLLVNQLGEYQRGREAQHLALGLAEKFKNFRTTCKTKLQLASWVNHWLNPLKESERLIDEAIQAGFSSGEFLYAGYAIGFKFPLAFFSGTNLEDLIKNTPKWLDLAERTKNVFSILLVQGCFPPINRLAGETVGQPAGLYPGLSDSNRAFGTVYVLCPSSPGVLPPRVQIPGIAVCSCRRGTR